ncbi:LPXTG-motif cell wall anchor domain-containing protein [Halorubrum coriense DSM 10284]|uniref:LPXTG-motif cell wall anchor domain-containing protein n=1 Tax=Halorubrum coriense DSM 10284 TaxID=1227466 RepID=M0EBK6_9EURY|nr:DUF4397 domain-containing protein [Halorubrum coriense]ELZ44262.1 LPXTG-motif cell wall anchor domain-containing protein [Halorubrum coriense DSM 10284]
MNTQLRIGHFSPDAPAVDVRIDGESLLENVSFGTLGDYMDVEAGSYDVDIVPASGDDAVLSATLEIDDGASYTVLAINALADIEALVLTDDRSAVDAGDARIRFVHTVPDAPAVDVMAGGSPLFENVAFGDSSSLATVDADAYDIDVRPSGSEDSVLRLSDIDFDGATAYTAFATGMLGDDSLDAMLVADFVATDADDRTITA